MGNFEANGNSNSEVGHHMKKHHSRLSTILISLIFIAAAIAWLIHVPAGILITIIGGIVFGLTYKS